MVDAFTSIKTTGGWADQAAASVAYDLLFRWALRTYPICRQFADVRPQDVRHQAKSYRIFKNADFAESTVTSALTPLDEETDVSAVKLPTPTYVDLTPTEYGFGTLRTIKLKNRALVQIDPVIAKAVKYHMVRVVDGLVQAKLSAGTNQVYMDQAGATNTATSDLVAGDVITSQLLRTQKSKFEANGVMPRDDAGNYVAVVHPHTELVVRTEAGSGGWRVPNEYGASQNRIWAGEVGQFEGFKFVTNPRIKVAADGASSINVYRSYLLGAEALAEAVNVEPHIEIAPTIDRLNRFAGLGWYGDMDFEVFRQEALVVVNSTLTAADAAAVA